MEVSGRFSIHSTVYIVGQDIGSTGYINGDAAVYG